MFFCPAPEPYLGLWHVLTCFAFIIIIIYFFIQNKNACHRWLIHTHNICIRPFLFQTLVLNSAYLYFITSVKIILLHTYVLSVLNEMFFFSGVSPSVSLVVSPSRSQHFSSDSLSLSCEDQRNSAGWTVRRYTDRNTEDCSKQTGSTCRIVSLSTSDSGVYWCQSESGEKRHPLNITVHGESCF